MNPILIAIRTIGVTVFFSGFLFKPTFAQNATLDNAISTAITQLSNSQAYANKSSYPRTVNTDGTIKRVNPGDWTCGFFPGQLWLMYEFTQQNIWKTRAEEWTAGLEGQKNNTNTHDVGFVMYSSFGNGLRLNPNDNYRNILLQTAQSLSTRYNPTVGAIQSWSNNPRYTYPVIIDNMMNLELLFWASKESGDQSFYNIAMQHSLTTISNHFRADNSSYHVVDFDPATGAVIKKDNFQGLNANSTWARGQAWGLYGFTMSYRETGDTRFLDQAKKIADFITAHPSIPGDKVPFWDYDVTDYRDVSAASITASALLELCEYIPSKTTSYYNYGINILNSLASSSYGAAPNTNNNFLLMHGVGNKPQNSEVDVPLIYSDYYFLQALMRYKKLAPFASAQSKATGQITLQWTKSTGAYFYNIKRSTNNGGPYTTVAANIKSLSYDDGGLQNGVTYYYIVVPATSTGEGIPSSQVSAVPMTPPQYSVNTSVSGNGSVSKNPDKALYDAGSTVSLTATPASGYQFNGWGGDASGVNNPLTVTVNGNKNISATFISSSNAPLVTNLAVNSNRTYALDQLAVGTVHYTDRNYTVTSVPSFLNGETMIRTANDDKMSTLTSLISFTLSKQATVYIAYDPRVTSLPAWTTGFQKTTSVIGVSDSKINNMELYSKQFAAGNVSLGGNMASPAAGALTGYFVVVKEQATQSNYSLNVSTSGNGSVSKNPDQASYSPGSTVSLTATPASGYQFSGWSGDVSGSSNPVNIVMNSNKSVTATFSLISSTPLVTNLSVNSSRSYVLDNLAVGVLHYTDRSYTVTSVPAYLNNEVMIRTPNDDKTNTLSSLITFQLNRPATVYIAYDPRATSLPGWLSTYQKLTDNIGVTDGSISSLQLYSKQFSAGVVTLGGNLASPASGAMTGYFVVIKEQVQQTQYSLNVATNGNGTVSKNPDQPSYPQGSTVTLTATPASGYQFTGWSGDASGTANPLSITMNADKSVTANFAQVTTYTVTATSAGNGSVSKNPDQTNYPAGTQVTITATPASGYQFNGWTGSVTSSANPLVITVNSNVSLVANFIQTTSTFTLATNVTGNGTISKNPDQLSYPQGSTVTLTATPASGYQFTGWSGDASGTANPVTIVMNSNKNVSATFSAAPVPIISDISANSASYILSILKTGGLVYTDRNTTTSRIPSFMENAAFISPPNDDRNQKAKNLFTFNLNQSATLYIAYDSRARSLPSWMNGWNKVGNTTISLNDGQSTTMEIYSQAFDPGNIRLGGNMSNPAKGAATNYFVIAIPSQTLTALNPARSGLDIPATQSPTTIGEIADFNIFPNPVENGIFKISGKNYSPGENINLQIIHINGRLIQAEKFVANEIGMLNKIITLKDKQASGIYFIRLLSPSKNVIKKLLIE